MRPFMVGLIIGLLAIPVAIYVYFATGMVPVETSAQAPVFEKMLAKKALHARVDKEMPRDVPIEANESNYLAGAQVYRKHCAMCHGQNADGQSRIQTAPWLAIIPGIAIVLTVLALNIFGDGLRDALDPRAKVRIEH